MSYNAKGLGYMRDPTAVSDDAVLDSLERAATWADEMVKEDYAAFLHRKFQPDKGFEPNPNAEYETSAEFENALMYHKRFWDIAKDRSLDVPEEVTAFESKYMPHPARARQEAIDEFVNEMPSGFTLFMDMSKFEE